ncbi:2-oxoglutarate dehydrogenase E1 subunit family protein, partial [Gordonia paraffinivorans]
MSSSSTSDFGQNTWLVEEMYQQFKEDPSSVDPSWHELLENYQPGGDSASNGKAPSAKAAPASANGTP